MAYSDEELLDALREFDAERGEPVLVGQTNAVPDDHEQLQQRHDRLVNEMDALAEEIERLEHEWKS